MGSLDINNQGNPSGKIKGLDYAYYAGYSFGRGAGPITTDSFSYVWWTIKPSPYAVKNRSLSLYNIDFIPSTTNPAVTAQAYDIYLLYAANSISAPDYTKATAHVSVPTSLVPPFYLTFDHAEVIPQQANASWDGHIYVVAQFSQGGLYLVDTAYGSVPQNYALFKTTNLDTDERL